MQKLKTRDPSSRRKKNKLVTKHFLRKSLLK